MWAQTACGQRAVLAVLDREGVHLPVLVISSTVYNEIGSEPTVLVALVVEQATDEGFCVDLGQASGRSRAW